MAQTHHWLQVLWLAHSAGLRVLLLLMDLVGLGGPWDLACLAPQASLVTLLVQAHQVPPQSLAVLGSQEGLVGLEIHPCLVGLQGLGHHWVPEDQVSPGILGSLWGPADLLILCLHALQVGQWARLDPSHQRGLVVLAPLSLLFVPYCQWDQGVPAVLCHLWDPWDQEDLVATTKRKWQLTGFSLQRE